MVEIILQQISIVTIRQFYPEFVHWWIVSERLNNFGLVTVNFFLRLFSFSLLEVIMIINHFIIVPWWYNNHCFIYWIILLNMQTHQSPCFSLIWFTFYSKFREFIREMKREQFESEPDGWMWSPGQWRALVAVNNEFPSGESKYNKPNEPTIRF